MRMSTTSSTMSNRAREALRLADAEPRRSAMLAAEVARQARDQRDHAAAAIAERALGLATLHLEDLDTAARHLRSAIALGRRARSPRLVAEARMTLAYTLSRRGRPRLGLREIDSALLDL